MIDLAAIKKRLEAATPGPWFADLGNWQVESVNEETYRDGICSFFPADRDRVDGTTNPISPYDDAEFIAHAPTDIANLLDALGKYDELVGRFMTACLSGEFNQNERSWFLDEITKVKTEVLGGPYRKVGEE